MYLNAIDDDCFATDDFSIVSQVPSSPAFALFFDPILKETVLTTPDGLDRETTKLFSIMLR